MIGLAFDTETTGLIYNATLPLHKQPEVIEFYGCLFDDKTGKIKEELDLLIHPTINKGVTDEIMNITGISNEMLVGKPKFKEVADSIFNLLRKAEFVTAHNLAYDREMLDFEYKRLDVKLLDTKDLKIEMGYFPAWPPRQICTVEQTTHLRGIRLSLSALHEYLFGEKFEGAHRAKADVQAQVRCFMELKKRGEL